MYDQQNNNGMEKEKEYDFNNSYWQNGFHLDSIAVIIIEDNGDIKKRKSLQRMFQWQ